MTDRYAVIGNPIAHSKSPLIHRMFAEQTGQDISYEAILAPLDGFAATIERLRKEGYKGCNVTVPFKFEAFKLATKLSERAKAAQAVNTLKFDSDTILGDNTDGAGLVRDITKNRGFDIAGKHVLLMGAGGAAYGVSFPLLEAGAALTIANRTVDKADILRQRLAAALRQNEDQYTRVFNQKIHQTTGLLLSGTIVESCGYGDLKGKKFDIVINATSASLPKMDGLLDIGAAPILPTDIFAPNSLAYDMMYGGITFFLSSAKQQGAQVADGLGMLVEQAAESFFIWRGVRPDTAPVLAKLRNA
ncbi:MAG: shikimate dehydrogenase [Betaproteobacteria bacterium]|nr:shikimate dehydrogenase [Betaproteobacteria bacterium]